MATLIGQTPVDETQRIYATFLSNQISQLNVYIAVFFFFCFFFAVVFAEWPVLYRSSATCRGPSFSFHLPLADVHRHEEGAVKCQ